MLFSICQYSRIGLQLNKRDSRGRRLPANYFSIPVVRHCLTSPYLSSSLPFLSSPSASTLSISSYNIDSCSSHFVVNTPALNTDITFNTVAANNGVRSSPMASRPTTKDQGPKAHTPCTTKEIFPEWFANWLLLHAFEIPRLPSR